MRRVAERTRFGVVGDSGHADVCGAGAKSDNVDDSDRSCCGSGPGWRLATLGPQAQDESPYTGLTTLVTLLSWAGDPSGKN